MYYTSNDSAIAFGGKKSVVRNVTRGRIGGSWIMWLNFCLGGVHSKVSRRGKLLNGNRKDKSTAT